MKNFIVGIVLWTREKWYTKKTLKETKGSISAHYLPLNILLYIERKLFHTFYKIWTHQEYMWVQNICLKVEGVWVGQSVVITDDVVGFELYACREEEEEITLQKKKNLMEIFISLIIKRKN